MGAPVTGRTRLRRIAVAIAAMVALGAAGALLVVGPSYARYRARKHALEARAGVRALCLGATDYQRETGVWMPAGPAPSSVPRGDSVPFPLLPEFERLGFSPGQVRFQYELAIVHPPSGGPHVRCIAHGDLDGDGKTSSFELELDSQGTPGPLRVENETD